MTRTAPTLALVVSILAGCLGGETLSGGTEDEMGALPPGLEMEGATVVAYDASVVRWRWEAVAPPNPAGVAGPPPVDITSLAATPAVEAAFDLPADLDVLLAARVVSEKPRTDLALEIRDAAGETFCRSDKPFTSRQACGAPVAPAGGPSRATVRVESAYVEPPGAPFVVEVTLALRIAIPPTPAPGDERAFEPHVVVATIDSGVNPYHEAYYRPERTMHPCTYLEGYPCDVPALELSVGLYDDWATAVAADAATWASVEPGSWYWIPRTALVAVRCQDESRWRPACILDDDGHGAATSSVILDENPDALLVVSQSEPDDMPAVAAGPAPIDVVSMAWAQNTGTVVGTGGRVFLGACQDFMRNYTLPDTLVVFAAGNQPTSTFLHCMGGDPHVVSVGGAEAEGDTEHPLTRKHPDVVSWTCRPAARHDSLDASWSPCGTSFAAPTVAGALSRAILEVRRASGFTGSLQDGVLDPRLGVATDDVRWALNLTSSYSPEAKFTGSGRSCVSPTPVCVPVGGVPLNPAAPWLQWGWGFYDSTVVNATVDHLLGRTTATKPTGAVQWMEAQHELKRTLWGS